MTIDSEVQNGGRDPGAAKKRIGIRNRSEGGPEPGDDQLVESGICGTSVAATEIQSTNDLEGLTKKKCVEAVIR